MFDDQLGSGVVLAHSSLDPLLGSILDGLLDEFGLKIVDYSPNEGLIRLLFLHSVWEMLGHSRIVLSL